MKELKNLKIFCLIGFLFVAIFGALSHFFMIGVAKTNLLEFCFQQMKARGNI